MAPTPDTQVVTRASDRRSAPVARVAPAGLTPQAARAAARTGISTVPASAALANGVTVSGGPAPTSTAQSSPGRVNTALTSTGPSSTGRNSTTRDSTALSTTGRVSTGPGSSTDLGWASQASTGPGRLDRLARDRADPGRSRRDRRAHTGRRTRAWRPGSLIPTRARVLTRPAHTRMAPGRPNTAPAVADRCPQDRGGPAARVRTTGRDRRAGRRQGRWAPGPPVQDRWGLARADAHGTGAARASPAAPVTMDPDNRERAPTALGIPARPRTGRAPARDRAGRAGGRPPDSTSLATGPTALAAPDARDGSATRRLAAPGLVPGMPGRGIGPAAP